LLFALSQDWLSQCIASFFLFVYDWSEICGRGFGYAMPHEIITAQVNQNNIDNISHQTTTTHTQITNRPTTSTKFWSINVGIHG
jgi:hypothetical protein